MISVVVPVHNDAAHLRACLEALRASTHRQHEVLVVDDGSTDATPEVAREYGVRLLQQDLRAGPAAARNRGAMAAHGEHLMFVDADVCVHADTLARVAAAFAADAGIDALFGSYDRAPREPNLLSQYKNLLHHFVHQQGAPEASTFWSGCGAIKRAVFLELGGFDAGYERPSIEDIELGVRLRQAGRRVVLRKDVQATHLKRWTFAGLLRSDFHDRGVPWTELILRRRQLPNDLNLKTPQRLCALMAYALAALFVAGCWRRPALVALPLVILGLVLALDAASARGRVPAGVALLAAAAGLGACALGLRTFALGGPLALALVLGIVLVNAPLYAFFARERGVLFALFALPLQVLYYLYSVVALAVGLARHLAHARRMKSAPRLVRP